MSRYMCARKFALMLATQPANKKLLVYGKQKLTVFVFWSGMNCLTFWTAGLSESLNKDERPSFSPSTLVSTYLINSKQIP